MKLFEFICIFVTLLLITSAFIARWHLVDLQMEVLERKNTELSLSLERAEDIIMKNGLWIVDWTIPIRWNGPMEYDPNLRWSEENENGNTNASSNNTQKMGKDGIR